MASILVLHGPNLNLLGTREPEIYGGETLADIDTRLIALGKAHGTNVQTLQSNAEHDIVNRIHSARGETAFIVINPGAFTHTSVAIRDAILGVDIPFFEVHISNVHARESFRHHSYFSDIAQGVICGLGSKGYDAALTAAIEHIKA